MTKYIHPLDDELRAVPINFLASLREHIKDDPHLLFQLEEYITEDEHSLEQAALSVLEPMNSDEAEEDS